MSYSIDFCRKKGKRLSQDEIEAFFADWSNITKDICEDDSVSSYTYYNKFTEVGFTFFFEPHPNASESSVPDSCVDVGLSANVPHARAIYYASEFFLVVRLICEHFDLFVIDPQDSKLPEFPFPISNIKRLVNNYEVGNVYTIQIGRQRKAPFVFFPMKKLLQQWSYNFRLIEIRENLGDDYFPSQISYVRKEGNRHAFSMAIWAKGSLPVIPFCDQIALADIHDQKDETSGLPSFRAIVPRKKLIHKLKKYLKCYRFKSMEMWIADQDSIDSLDRMFDQIVQSGVYPPKTVVPVEEQILDAPNWIERFTKGLNIFWFVLLFVLMGILVAGYFVRSEINSAKVAWEKGQTEEMYTHALHASFFAIWWRDKAYVNYLLGVAENRRKNYKSAILHLEKTLQTQPTYEPTYVALGNAYINLMQYEQARIVTKKALELNPDDAWAHDLNAILYWYDKKYPEALQEYEQAIKLAPNEDVFQHRADELRAYLVGK